MSGFLRSLVIVIMCTSSVFGSSPTIKSIWTEHDVALDTNPSSAFWQGAVPVYMDNNAQGKPDPKYRTEILIRAETNELWNWDVAEVFIGSDFNDIRRYKEFEISPQGEWIDLDVDLHKPHHEDGWMWNSGMEVSARIDRSAHVWYGAMRIPYSAIDSRPAAAGNVLRINLFRSQGPASARHEIAWQAPMSNTFHVPERFGLLELVKK
ncbi:MAG: carbohydrate-binding family 9-like protein [Candidatus Sulfotelmatobacter sp.]|jgi:hypothetical protein